MTAEPLNVEDFDWSEAFRYAEGGNMQGAVPDIRRAVPAGDDTPLDSFGQTDVEHVEAFDAGEHDGPEWVCLGRLKDGRWFYLSAGCDYTGWDCAAGGSATVASSLEDLLKFGLTDSERARLDV